MFSENPADKIPQLEAMRAGVNYRLTVVCRDFSVQLRPLTIDETQQIAVKVVDAMSRMTETSKIQLTEHLILAKETLQLASTSDVGETDYVITSYMLGKMTPAEIQYLHRQYVMACDKVNPCLEEMAKAEVEALAERIKKKDLHLTELSFLQLVNVCRLLTQSD